MAIFNPISKYDIDFKYRLNMCSAKYSDKSINGSNSQTHPDDLNNFHQTRRCVAEADGARQRLANRVGCAAMAQRTAGRASVVEGVRC